MLKKINRFRAQIFFKKTPQIYKKTDFFIVKGFKGGVVNRFSIILSKKNINSSVVRNSLKRLIFNSLKPYLRGSHGMDYIIIPSPKIKKDFNSELIGSELKKIMDGIR